MFWEKLNLQGSLKIKLMRLSCPGNIIILSFEQKVYGYWEASEHFQVLFKSKTTGNDPLSAQDSIKLPVKISNQS